MTTANESKLGGARGGHRGPIVLRVAAARVLPLLPVAARGARLVLSMGLAAGCVRARSSSSPLRGGHCPPLAASTSRLEVWLRCSVHVGCGTPLFRRVVGCRRPARVREGQHAEARQRVAGSALSPLASRRAYTLTRLALPLVGCGVLLERQHPATKLPSYQAGNLDSPGWRTLEGHLARRDGPRHRKPTPNPWSLVAW